MPLSPQQSKYHTFVESRLRGMDTTRYSWWTHWRELAEYFLPRRYRWVVNDNRATRGSPINQHILDSAGVLAARNLASGLMSGKISPSQQWLKLRVNKIDSTGTTPASLWLGECERLMRLVLSESNFYTSVAQWLYDLVIFGTAVLIIHHDFENVINCSNPCAGEFYVALDGRGRPSVLYRKFTMTVDALVDEFEYANCSGDVQRAFDEPGGAGLAREIIIAHAIEPNDDGRDFGVPDHFEFRECYWEWGGSDGVQGSRSPDAFLRVQGYAEQPHATVRWDIVSNDPYGRSVAMDALPDQKQLQLQTRRKAQAIDKMVNPPLVADAQLKNQPASALPGGMTYVAGFAQQSRPAIASIYDTKFPIDDLAKDMEEGRERLKYTFYNHLFQPISQFETRSNITAVEINQRKSESLIMLGPVFERLDNEGLRPIVERVFGIMSRAGILPPPPPEIAGKEMTIEFVSMLALAQDASNSAGIQQVLALAGQLAAIDQGILDCIDMDFAIDNYSALLNNDPRMMRSADAVAKIRADKARAQAQAQQADNAQKLAAGAANLAKAPLSSGGTALDAAVGG